LRATPSRSTIGSATKASVEGARPFRVHTPLLNMTKANIVRKAASLGVDFRLT
jgi:7-cyano-7-deazaguanine synthase